MTSHHQTSFLTRQKEAFETLGYTVLKGCVENELITKAKQTLIKNVEKFADDLDVNVEWYLGSVSRWGNSSLITKKLRLLLNCALSKSLYHFFQEKVNPVKWNVICKNAHNTRPVPFHQDICYSPHQPYQFSAWLALDDVDEQSGPLIVQTKSHTEPLQPAVDFWSLLYTPVNKPHTRVLAQKGDLILFDSRLWHGSAPATKKTDRFAFVSRWSCQSYEPPKDIPGIQKAPFGMWTCQEVTQNILMQGGTLLIQQTPWDFVDLLELWATYLRQQEVPFKISVEKAVLSLERLKTLHLAHLKHDGGDASGTLYKDLWQNLLKELQAYSERSKNESIKRVF